MVKKEIPIRMDFIQEIIKIEDNEDGSTTFGVKLTPNPRRYELKTINGEKGYWSEKDNIFIPLDVFKKFVDGLAGTPIYYDPPKENDFLKYQKVAKQEHLEKWDEEYILPDEIQISEILLKEVNEESLQFVIIYVDMAGSTKLSKDLDQDTYEKIIKIFLMQMAKVIDNCKGFVLKYVGDCVVGYFKADNNFSGICDNAIMAGMLMSEIIHGVINPVLKLKGLPEIGYHIGIDIGDAKITRIGAEGISSSHDLIGYVMNRTAKIQALSNKNQILIGESLYRLIHSNWQDMCSKIDSPQDWQHGTVYEFKGNSRVVDCGLGE